MAINRAHCCTNSSSSALFHYRLLYDAIVLLKSLYVFARPDIIVLTSLNIFSSLQDSSATVVHKSGIFRTIICVLHNDYTNLVFTKSSGNLCTGTARDEATYNQTYAASDWHSSFYYHLRAHTTQIFQDCCSLHWPRRLSASNARHET